MKLILLLLPYIAISMAEEPDFFDMFEQSIRTTFDWMANITSSDILNEDGTDFHPKITATLALAESQFCPVESTECDPDERWLFGCNCREGFQALGECKKKPCLLFRHFKNNGINYLSNFINAESYEEIYGILFKDLMNPIFRSLCECSGMIGATVNCVKNYDGSLFEMVPMDRSGCEKTVDRLDWKTIKGVLNGWIEAGCGYKNGKDCVTELSKVHTLSGTMLDNTFNRKDVCLSMIRFKEEFIDYFMSYEALDSQSESFDSIGKGFNLITEAFVKMERVALCEPSCAAEVSDAFYSCCAKDAFEGWSSKSMQKKYKKLFENVWPLIFDAENEAPDLSQAMRKYFSIFDIESFCGDKTDVYKVKNEQCETNEA